MKLWNVVSVLLLPLAGHGAEIRAGVAKADLPLGPGVRLAGFAGKRISSGVHDPLQARVLLLRTATESVALVACDLHDFQSRRVSEEARRTMNIGSILFAASGTHAAPGTALESDRSWVPAVEETILGALRQADSATFAARFGAGQGTADLAYNWRMVDPDGVVTMLWRNPERRATGPLFPGVPVWRIDTQDGELRVVLFGSSARASLAGKDNTLLSGDYPGHAARRVEASLGSGVIALFLQGAAGNLAPRAGEGAPEHAKQAGEELAEVVVRVARGIQTAVEPNPDLSVQRTQFEFQERWGNGRNVPIETATVVVNRSYALVAVPGAPFVEHQINLADRSPALYTILAAHTQTANGQWAGILPTIRAAAQGGYGASYATRLEPGAGEALVDAALVNIYRVLGKLDDLPRGSLVREMPPEGRPR